MIAQDQIIFRIIQSARTVHQSLGPGFVENIYSRALIMELKSEGFLVEREKLIRVRYGNAIVGRHRLDMVVDATVIVELKANRGIIPVHVAQLNSYLHATQYPAGLIINFGTAELQHERIFR